MNSNPLISAYKKPKLYITLPSGGKYYKVPPKMSVDGEIAIYPMTARDEVISKTPDALFNGEATIALIKSCCPDIVDPRHIPVNDLLVLLLAIRMASYGNEMEMDLQCPECDHHNQLMAKCDTMLATASVDTMDDSISLDNGFKLKVKPFSLEDRTLMQIQQVKQNKLIQQVSAETDEKLQAVAFGKTFLEITELTIQLISNSIVSVTISEEITIEDGPQILEWLSNISKSDYDMIKDHVDKMSEHKLDTNLHATCQVCSHEWTTELELDIANFFAG